MTKNVNRHIQEFLRYYLDLQEPVGYAVLVSGQWGVGKSYQVLHTLKEILPDDTAPKLSLRSNERVLYVSLNGLKSAEEIEDRIASAMYPILDSRGVRIAGGATRAALKFFKIDPDEINLSELAGKIQHEVLVFDDLERASMPVSEVLGFINEFVENEGRKVIIIANEDEIEEAEFARIKEKIVGQTLRVYPDFDGAFESFLPQISNAEARDFLTANIADIKGLYLASSLNNFRSLARAMLTFERVFICLDETSQSNSRAVKATLQLLFLLSFEIKAGTLSEQDIKDRQGDQYSWMLDKKKEGGKPVIHEIQDKYTGVNVFDSVLNDEVLLNLFFEGLVDCESINESVQKSGYFSSDKEPEWRTVWYYAMRDSDAVMAAATEMRRKFADEEYDEVGVLLHVVGLMIELCQIGESDVSKEEMIEQAKAHVVSLREQGRLQAAADNYLGNFGHGAHDGLGFTNRDDDKFKEFWQFLQEQREIAERDSFVEAGKLLLNKLQGEPSEFAELVSDRGNSAGEYSQKPVLAQIDAKDFAEKVADLDAESYYDVMQSLGARYEQKRLEGPLSEEKPWIKEVHNEITEIADKREPFERERLKRNLRWAFNKVVEYADLVL